jgi:hypothetical protein
MLPTAFQREKKVHVANRVRHVTPTVWRNGNHFGPNNASATWSAANITAASCSIPSVSTFRELNVQPRATRFPRRQTTVAVGAVLGRGRRAQGVTLADAQLELGRRPMPAAGFHCQGRAFPVVLDLAEQPVMRPIHICPHGQIRKQPGELRALVKQPLADLGAPRQLGINRRVAIRTYPVFEDMRVDELPRVPVAEHRLPFGPLLALDQRVGDGADELFDCADRQPAFGLGLGGWGGGDAVESWERNREMRSRGPR